MTLFDKNGAKKNHYFKFNQSVSVTIKSNNETKLE